MRIVLACNSLHCNTGYATQGRKIVKVFQELGHEVAVQAFYGVQGGMLNIEGVPHYASLRDMWGQDVIGQTVKHFGADISMTLHDAWVLAPGYQQKAGVPWLCYAPIDSEPAAPATVERMREARFPVVYSRFGLEQMTKAGVRCDYIPHMCFDYNARVQVSPDRVEALGDIVTGQVVVDRVLGLDNGQIRSVRVLNRFILPHQDSVAVKIRTAQGRTVVATRNNDILTPQGWRPAGDLMIGDYVCKLGRYGRIHTEPSSLDTRRIRAANSALSNCDQRGIERNLQASVVGYSSASNEARTSSKSIGSTAAQSGLPLRTDSAGVGVYRGDDRRRRVYLSNFSAPEEGEYYSNSSRCCDHESVRNVNSLAYSADLLVSAICEAGHQRTQLGVQADNQRPSLSDLTRTNHALLSHQTAASGGCNRVLSSSSSMQSVGALQRSGLGTAAGDTSTEQSEVVTYDRIESIEFVSLDTVYDITTECGNFLIDGIIVHNCDTDVFKPGDKVEARKHLGLPDGFMVSMVAANKGFPSRKAFPEQLSAFAEFYKTHPDSFLFLHTMKMPVGGYTDGIYFDTLLKDLGLHDKGCVYFSNEYLSAQGMFTEEDVAKVYQASDVLMAASFAEGFGLPILEAQACFPAGTNVVVDNVLKGMERPYTGPLLTITTDMGSVEVTPDHPFWTSDGWLQAKHIVSGSQLLYNPSYAKQGIPSLHAGRIEAIVEAIQDQDAKRSSEGNGQELWSGVESKASPRSVQDVFANQPSTLSQVKPYGVGVHGGVDRWRGNGIHQGAVTQNQTMYSDLQYRRESHGVAGGSDSGSVNIFRVSNESQTESETIVCLSRSRSITSAVLSQSASVHGHQERADGIDHRVFSTQAISESPRVAYLPPARTYCTGPGTEYQTVRSVSSRYVTNSPVYNFTTLSGVYFAEGYLVHNCGCPVITTNFSSMPELTFNGICTKPLSKEWSLLGCWQVSPDPSRILPALCDVYTESYVPRTAQVIAGINDLYSCVAVKSLWKTLLDKIEAELSEMNVYSAAAD